MSWWLEDPPVHFRKDLGSSTLCVSRQVDHYLYVGVFSCTYTYTHMPYVLSYFVTGEYHSDNSIYTILNFTV